SSSSSTLTAERCTRAEQRARIVSSILIALPVAGKAQWQWPLPADSSSLFRRADVFVPQPLARKTWRGDSHRKRPISFLGVPDGPIETVLDTVPPAPPSRPDRKSAQSAAGCHIRVKVQARPLAG